jgi:hypothetical protein
MKYWRTRVAAAAAPGQAIEVPAGRQEAHVRPQVHVGAILEVGRRPQPLHDLPSLVLGAAAQGMLPFHMQQAVPAYSIIRSGSLDQGCPHTAICLVGRTYWVPGTYLP